MLLEEVEELSRRNGQYLDCNTRLAADIDLSRAHLESLASLNHALTLLLERASAEDHELLAQLDRRQRVQARRAQVDQANALLVN